MDIEMKAAVPYMRKVRKNDKNIARRTGKPIKAKSGTAKLIRKAALADPALVEIKALDIDVTTTSLNSGTSVSLLNGMTIGANAFQRLGRKTSVKSVRVTGYVYQNQAGAAPTVDYMRIAIVYDKQPDGAAPTWAQVFTSVDGGGTPFSTALANPNLDNRDRFIILRDLRYKADAPAGAVLGNQPVPVSAAQTECKWIVDEYIKLKGVPTMYSATSNTGGVADIQTGGLFLLTCALSSAANAQYAFQWTARVRYTDI